MRQCASCGKRATVGYNRYMRFLPHPMRMFCDSCFSVLQRREDLIFISFLFAVFFSTVGVIAIIHFSTQKQIEQDKQQLDAYYDANDLNKDGYIDFWEETATDKMKTNLSTYGYPWKKVLPQDASGARLAYMIDRSLFMEISKQNKFFKFFNFPDLMSTHLATVTSPDSLTQLLRVFVTQNSDIVYVLRVYDSTPEGGFSDEYFQPGTKGKSAKKLEPVQVIVCLEPASRVKLNEMVGIEAGVRHIENFRLANGPPKKKKKGK